MTNSVQNQRQVSTPYLASVLLLGLVFALGVTQVPLVQAQTFTTLYTFTGGSDGRNPYAGVIRDNAGNLYGTTTAAGDLNCAQGYGCGTAYKLDTTGRFTVLYTFMGSDGDNPISIVRRKGSLYGTTVLGGSSGHGLVYKIDSTGKETVLHSFMGGTTDGCDPQQGVVRDKAGNLYGTTAECGASNNGTVYKLTPKGKLVWLYSFTGGASGGSYPANGHLLMDKEGNLYGVTWHGGPSGNGVLYKMTSRGKLTLLHIFEGGTTDGCYPFGRPAMDKAGDLYGTTANCGTYDFGTVWKVSKDGAETILHSFAGGTSDGYLPLASVALDSKGNMYGTTQAGGAGSCQNGCGVLYKLSKSGALTLLHSFEISGGDGAYPTSGVWVDPKGGLYGTAYDGGSYDLGTVWAYKP